MSLTRESPASRVIFVDDNVDCVGGHYYELAALLMQATHQSGAQPILISHAEMTVPSNRRSSHLILPTFQSRRMVRWSLGEDGRSKLVRDLDGNPQGGRWIERLQQKLTDSLESPKKRPQAMIEQWSSDFCGAIRQIQPTNQDTIVINTGDDFVLLALANALKRNPLPGVRIDVIFHFSLGDQHNSIRLRRIGEQVRSAIASIGPERLFLHATTKPLVKQWKGTGLAKHVSEIPYPSRSRSIRPILDSPAAIKAVLAGAPRAEKGREAFVNLLAEIHHSHLKNDRFQVSLQIPENRANSMIPKCLQSAYQQALQGKSDGVLEVMPENLSTNAYHDWLDTGDLGLFLYDPKRYAVRCSGVLLEMLARGVPVIVPDRCWLADEVRRAGGHRSIGFIYQDRSEIPDLMRQFADHQVAISNRAIAYAKTVQARHCAINTLKVMGILAAASSRQAA